MRAMTALLLTCLWCAPPLAAQDEENRPKPPTRLYKWTDADGVVQYSATPVEGQETTVIEIRRGPPPPPPPPEPIKGQLSCEQLQENVRLLQSDSKFLQVIENGVPRRLTEEERLPQLEAAKIALEDCENAEEEIAE